MRLIRHSAAYWLVWAARRAVPETAALRHAESATIRLKPLNIAARVIATASRIRIAFACPDAVSFRTGALNPRAASP